MHRCHACGGAVLVDKYFTRKSACPKCGRDLRVCLNCAFHSPSSHNKCLEPQAEFQRDRDRANLCDYFRFREGGATGGGGAAADEARRRLDDLFER